MSNIFYVLRILWISYVYSVERVCEFMLVRIGSVDDKPVTLAKHLTNFAKKRFKRDGIYVRTGLNLFSEVIHQCFFI